MTRCYTSLNTRLRTRRLRAPRRANVSATGRATLIAFALAVAASPVSSDEITEPRRPRVTLMNDDSVLFWTYCSENPTANDLLKMLDEFDNGVIDALTQNVHDRWQAYYDSKVVEIAGDLTPEAVKPWEESHYWHWFSALHQLIARGDDPPKVLAGGARERGMLFLPSFRLNDRHSARIYEGHNGSFRRDNPQWKLGEAANSGMNYGVPEVREHILKVVAELAQRYDIDGIDLDMMRWPHFFKKDEVKANTPVMTEFVRQIRSILDKAGKSKGRRLLLSVRVPLKIGEGKVINASELSPDLECLGVGLDVGTWIDEGLIDMVCPMNFFFTAWEQMIVNMAEWRQLTDDNDCGLYPTIHAYAADKYTPPYISAESYRGAAHSYYLHGADGIALYNFHDQIDNVKGLNDPAALASMSRRYHCRLGIELGVGPVNAAGKHKDRRLAADFFLPEDPQAANVKATLEFAGRDLTTKHEIAIDVNGTPIASDSIKFEKLRVGGKPGSPNRKYGNLVSFPLAGTAASKGKNVLGIRLIKSNPELPFIRAAKYGPVWGGFKVSEVEAFFEPR